jgi:hypothetical protein
VILLGIACEEREELEEDAGGLMCYGETGLVQPIALVIMKVTNKMQLYRLIYFSLSALHVSGDVFTDHRVHLTVFTVSGSIYLCCC